MQDTTFARRSRALLALLGLCAVVGCDRFGEDEERPAKTPKAGPVDETLEEPDEPVAADADAQAGADAPPPEDPAPKPCRIVEAVFERDEAADDDTPGFSSVSTQTVEAAGAWTGWDPSKHEAPPPMTPAALERIAPLSDGVYVSEDSKVTFALDVSDRLALAVIDHDPGAPMTQFIYQYDCEPAGLKQLPGADEGGWPEPYFAAKSIPVHASPGEASTETTSVRRGKKVKYEESRVLVQTPVVGWVSEPVRWKLNEYDPTTQTYGELVEVSIPKGRVAYVYGYEGEGYCFVGDGKTLLGSGDCLTKELRPPAIDPREPEPLVWSWWLQLAGKDGGWVEVRPETIETRFRHGGG